MKTLMVLITLLISSSTSFAALIFEVERISDYEARITGAGVLEVEAGTGIALWNVLDLGDSIAGSHDFSGVFALGQASLSSIYHFASGSLIFSFGEETANLGDELFVDLYVTLYQSNLVVDAIWKEVGTANSIVDFVTADESSVSAFPLFNIIGGYSVQSSTVPLPAAIWFFGASILALTGLRIL